ncbi:hypothetical protein PWF70_12175 [Gordonia sp. Swx-4]|uniref:hypothetical protein n=1 Tax=Gordonia sp. Swx-4 TaxID=3029399 RepID=UPI002572623B|nr:hypothetical protein [Gordonia sp. Swx-4]WJG11408.1 hypothetical protein PWF70_12175 [Gordonia sp. Swx-4]
MALIRSLERGKGGGRPPQSEVDGTYIVVDDPDRGKILKITTYGSDMRKSGPKPSQVIELDEEMAQKLINVLQRELNIPSRDIHVPAQASE